MNEDGGSTRLISDPSTLTTAAVQREIEHLKELTFNRFDSIQKAVDLAHADMVRVPTLLDRALANHQALQDEKFSGVQKQFDEGKVAVAAALQAAKELVIQQNVAAAQSITKQEDSFTKQIDQQGKLLSTMNDALNGKIDDLKERIGRIESRGEGVNAADARHQSARSQIIAIIGALVGIAGLLFGIFRGLR